jgi:hypothetical protein
VVCGDSQLYADCRRSRIRGLVFAWPDRGRSAAVLKKIWGRSAGYGTLWSSRVFANKRLPQQVRFIKYLEGDLPHPITLLDQIGAKRHHDP